MNIGIPGINSREQYDEAKGFLEQIHYELKTQPLTAKQRQELELHAARLAGFLCRPWLPVSWGRRLIMAAIFVFSLQQAWVGNYQPMLWWLLFKSGGASLARLPTSPAS
jgi:hypothetical protein